MESLQKGSVGLEKFTVTSTAKGGCPKQRTGRIPAQSRPPFLRSVDTMTDSQSYRLMEERYGIREEGIF
ncbi:MAG: hypothetical protein IH628_17515 [Proteobacteria bacterium]|nr:hypothetical protein [Pseudomonadota bacterium]